MGHRIVYCSEHGGFSLSPVAAVWLAGKGDQEASEWLAEVPLETAISEGHAFYPGIPRHSPLLLACYDELGTEAFSGRWSHISVAEIEGDEYIIQEYDGKEFVVEPKDIRWIKVEGGSEQDGGSGVE